VKKLKELKNVGKAALADLVLLEINSVEELARQDATFLFHELERRTKHRQYPCVWDVFAAIIHEAATGEASSWWEWTAKRKNLQKKKQIDHVI